MRTLNLNFILTQSRIHPDLIFKYADGAEQYVQSIVGKTFDEIEKEYGTIPQDFSFASLLMVNHLIELGEPNPYTGMCLPISAFHIPYGIKPIIAKYATPGIDERIAEIEKIFRH